MSVLTADAPRSLESESLVGVSSLALKFVANRGVEASLLLFFRFFARLSVFDWSPSSTALFRADALDLLEGDILAGATS